MIHIACVFTGKKYSLEYVQNLYEGVAKHMPEAPWIFTVLTDQPELFDGQYVVKDVRGLELPGYWNKVALFKPGMFPDGERVIYFDLDVIITGSLDKVLNTSAIPFVIMHDPIMAGRWNSSVMSWNAGSLAAESIWTRFVAGAERPYKSRLTNTKGDQAWIEWVFRNPIEGKPQKPRFWDSGLVCGYYSVDGDKGWAKLEGPGEASVIVFHGKPRFTDPEMAQWAKEIWNGVS